MKQFLPRYQAILFDLDGTLVDSNEFHALAWSEAFAGRGIVIDPARIGNCIGMGGDNLVPAITDNRIAGGFPEAEDRRAPPRYHFFGPSTCLK